ncbi:endonuclease/exonuclease/phosphatase family protein [Pedobacter hiemivivus]|uniref:Endonuclease/exonuclease/phosphatase family protein n=1 Tax=Pedobacter hiemivivus TaxID=2530454 RepID=A0A4U1GL82_9SPHI|nr:endonuclease/exonuclease/phosphatase family protein [Pedobacter hiemivivus]TKC64998.1 endonuclease/exonuclease/phosphatase family protein [Pedobacter hiemivivus]
MVATIRLKFIGFALLLCCTLVACKKKNRETAIEQGTFKVLSYNVYEGFSGDAVKKQGFKKWIDTMKPDVIALQEMKGFTKAGLQNFAVEMGYNYTLMWHEAGLPVALVSKYPITEIKTVPSNLHLIQAKVLDYNFFVIHLSPLTYDIRKAEMEIILARTQVIPKTEKILMMGDFNNMSPQDASFYNTTAKMDLIRASELSNPGTKILNNGQIDYTTIQNIMDEGFYDTWKIFRSNYEKSAPTKLRTHNNFTRIDYIFMNKAILNHYKDSYLVKDVYTDYMSDHYPMVLILKK